jgi:hypothetical protein
MLKPVWGPQPETVANNKLNSMVEYAEEYAESLVGDAVTQVVFDAHTGNTSNPHVVTKAQIGLGNADNTSDANKPISAATQTALDAKADLVAGKVQSAQLPAFVDDVIEAANFAALPGTGETGKIYVTLDDNKTFRWSGSAYVEISASLALGETSATAYRGDRGAAAYDHSQATGNPHGTKFNQLSDAPSAYTGNGEKFVAVKADESGVEFVAAPTGGATTSAPFTASEALAANDIVSVWNSSGAKVRKANATDSTKIGIGFVDAAVSSSASATVEFAGIISGLSGLTIGADYFLATTGGGITTTPPSASGNIVQKIGTALSATELLFAPDAAVELA